MNDSQVIKSLIYLRNIDEAGERGYIVSAVNIENPGLKILFKSFAKQRADFKDEIQREVERLGGTLKPGNDIRGIVHRGRIAIFAALTIGILDRERVILNEIIIGEKAALRAYEKTLKEDIPPATRAILSKQYDEIKQHVDQIHLLRGTTANRMIAHLFDAQEDERRAINALRESGTQPVSIGYIDVNNELRNYDGMGTTVRETSISGAFGGALWGSLIGVLAGVSVAFITQGNPPNVVQMLLIGILVAIGCMLGGAFVGMVLGFLIGLGISNEHENSYTQSGKYGRIVLLAVIDNTQISKAQQIFSQLQPVARTNGETG